MQNFLTSTNRSGIEELTGLNKSLTNRLEQTGQVLKT
jgi:hypothetical protein